MTVAALAASVSYLENGTSTAFPAPFRFKSAGDLVVDRVLPDGAIVPLTLGADYTVTGGATDAGGTVTRTAATTGGRLRIRRRTARQQPMVYTAGDRFPAKSHEEALDRQMLIAQEQDASLAALDARALRLPDGEVSPNLPGPAQRKGKVIGFDPLVGQPYLMTPSYFGDPLAARNTIFSIGKSYQDKLSESIALDDARTSWASDQDTIALAQLVDDGYRRIRCRGGKGVGTERAQYRIGAGPWRGMVPGAPEGSPNVDDYLEGRGNLSRANGQPAHGLELCGDGMDLTEIQQVAIGSALGTNGNYLFTHNSLSEDEADNLQGFILRDMTLTGLGGAASQAGHIMALAGVTGFTAERVRFRGFQGDGLIAWMGPNPTTERHNRRFRFLHCHFDGVNQENRNCISIEDCFDWLVFDCLFENACKRDDNVSVGAIDLEPRDRTSYRNGKGQVLSSRFRNIGNAAVAFYVNAPDYYALKSRDYRAIGNTVEDCYRGFDVVGGTDGEIAAALFRHDISIMLNELKNVERPFRSYGGCGVTFAQNRMDDVGSMQLGAFGTGRGNREVDVLRNRIARGGRDTGAILLHDDLTIRCRYEDNAIIGGGRRDVVAGWPLLVRFGAQDITVRNNPVDNTGGRLTGFALKTDEAGATGAGCVKSGNTLFGAAYTQADNWNPAAPITGLQTTYVFPSSAGIPGFGGGVGSPGQANFDIPLAGAIVGRAYRVWPNFYPPTTERVLWDAVGLADNTVRLIVTNSGAGWAIAAGQSVTIAEDVA
jgi:hypothetical protein